MHWYSAVDHDRLRRHRDGCRGNKRRGAFNYITKALQPRQIFLNIDRMIAQQRIIEENKYLHSELEKVYGLKRLWEALKKYRRYGHDFKGCL